MRAYYNEYDKYAAQWLRNLIAAGHIAAGDVDERSISEVKPADLDGYTQCHFFAGIGGWSLALRLAGWGDDRPVWTGSCPCQPFSVAGAGAGVTDERHLWPHWFHLIRAKRPATVFGEQVDAAIKHGWLNLVQDDMEAEGYEFGAVGVPAASVGAPHIRQRLWFVANRESAGSSHGGHGGLLTLAGESSGVVGELANNNNKGSQGWVSGRSDTQREVQHGRVGCDSAACELADDHGNGCQSRDELRLYGTEYDIEHGGGESRLGDSEHNGLAGAAKLRGDGGTRYSGWEKESEFSQQLARAGQPLDGGGLHGSEGSGKWATVRENHWSDCDWIPCRDGKWRPVEPGTFPLAHGVSNRVGRLRAYGNAIVPQVAEQIIRAYLECRP